MLLATRRNCRQGAAPHDRVRSRPKLAQTHQIELGPTSEPSTNAEHTADQTRGSSSLRPDWRSNSNSDDIPRHRAKQLDPRCSHDGSQARIMQLRTTPKRTFAQLKNPIEAVVTFDSALLQTPLHEWHQSHGGRLVEFGGWSMPVQYKTIAEEHETVRKRVGLFDISHMGRLTFDGQDVIDWLERVTTNRVAALTENQIQYSLVTNTHGGVIDDILVYRQPYGCLVVCNASNRERIVEHFQFNRRGATANFADRTRDTAMIAVQGPLALETVQPLFDQPLAKVPYYHLTMGQLLGSLPTVVSRTGYTGEDGFELIVGESVAVAVWEALLKSGARHGIVTMRPGGAGHASAGSGDAALRSRALRSRSTLSRQDWAGRSSSTRGSSSGESRSKTSRNGRPQMRVGLTLPGKRIARQGSAVFHENREVGAVTSGTFSPTLQVSLGMAYVEPAQGVPGTRLSVDIRGHREPAEVVALPFYKRPRKASQARLARTPLET